MNSLMLQYEGRAASPFFYITSDLCYDKHNPKDNNAPKWFLGPFVDISTVAVRLVAATLI